MTTEMTYRRMSVAGASPIGLMIVLLDTLVGDFRRAVAALDVNDIETRCRELNHAILVLGQLDSWVDIKNGGESAQALARFYAYLRAKMMEAMGTKSARLLEAQIAMILHVRSAWHNLDTQQLPVPEKLTEALSGVAGSAYQSMQDGIAERVRFSQTA